MKNRKWFFIVNATAGRGKTGKKINKIIQVLNRNNIDFEIELTKAPQHATQLTLEALDKSYKNIVSVGGDGTLNEVVNGIMKSENSKDVVLGLLPEGGGNDFARNFNLSDNINDAVEKLLDFNTRAIDVGKIEDKYFINALGIGFDARVAIISNKIKYLNGLPRYLYAVFRALISLETVKAELKLDSCTLSDPFLLVSIGNGLSTGGGFLLTPEARTDDGLLDICLINKVNRRRILSLLPSAIKGKHLKEPEVILHQSRQIEITTSEPLPIYYDGEIPELKDPLNFKIELIPQAIRFIC